ncbi:MAG: exosortase A [Gammaproteobacteria bacterium]
MLRNDEKSHQSIGPGPLMVVGVALLSLGWALRDTFSAMTEIWLNSSTFNHCLLIAPAAAYLIWRRRHRLAECRTRGSIAGLTAFAACAVLWGIGALGGVATVQNVAAVGMISTAIWAVLGNEVARTIAFPLTYLLFMVPFGEFIVPALMEWTANVTVVAARASGVSVYKDGLLFTIPNGSFRIVEACSGIRMLIASIAVAVLFAHLNFRSWYRRIVFVLAMIVASLIANGIRTYSIVMIGYYTSMETIADHELFGYVIFGSVLILMLIVGSRFSDIDGTIETPLSTPSDARGSIPTSIAAAAAVVALSLGIPAAVARSLDSAQQDPGIAAMRLPNATTDWSGPRSVRDDWAPRFVGYDAADSGTYLHGTDVVDVYMISYSAQRQGAELINPRNRLFDAKRWTLLHKTAGDTALTDGGSIPYIELEIRDVDASKRLIRYWYIVDEQVQYRPTTIKLRELKNSIFGRATPGTWIAVSTKFAEDRVTAGERLDNFVREIYARAYPVD